MVGFLSVAHHRSPVPCARRSIGLPRAFTTHSCTSPTVFKGSFFTFDPASAEILHTHANRTRPPVKVVVRSSERSKDLTQPVTHYGEGQSRRNFRRLDSLRCAQDTPTVCLCSFCYSRDDHCAAGDPELANLPWLPRVRLTDSGSDSDSNLLINFILISGIHCVAADRTSLPLMTP